MTKIRPEVKRSQWTIPKHSFYTAYHYALQYLEWKDRYTSIVGLSSVAADGMPHGLGVSNPTESHGMVASELSRKMELIEDTAREASEELYPWLMRAVTRENVTYNYLQTVMNIPCGKNTYYDVRRKFYYLLSQKI